MPGGLKSPGLRSGFILKYNYLMLIKLFEGREGREFVGRMDEVWDGRHTWGF